MFAPAESLCAAGCGLCFRKFYQRQPLLIEMGWAVYDVMSNVNHGMEFCPLSASYLFLLAGINLCYPLLLRTLSVKQMLKHALLCTLPFLTFTLFWRPFNFLILFLVRSTFGLIECEDVYLRGLSYLSALILFILSLLFTRKIKKETTRASRGSFGFAFRRPVSKATVHKRSSSGRKVVISPSAAMMHGLRASHEYRRTRSGCIYGYW